MTSAHTINPFTNKTLPYDTERDFTPITSLVRGAIALVGSPKAGFDTMAKFLAAAKANPGKYQFGSTENTTRVVGELFKLKSGLKIENVAYKGAAPMMQELAGGHIPVGFTSPLTVMSHHRAGTLRMLAVSTPKRLAALPEIPTIAESGVPGVEIERRHACAIAHQRDGDVQRRRRLARAALLVADDEHMSAARSPGRLGLGNARIGRRLEAATHE